MSTIWRFFTLTTAGEIVIQPSRRCVLQAQHASTFHVFLLVSSSGSIELTTVAELPFLGFFFLSSVDLELEGGCFLAGC